MQASMPYYSIARATCHHYREIMSAQMQYTKQSRSISPYKSTLISSFCNQYADNYVITFPITETLALGKQVNLTKRCKGTIYSPRSASFAVTIRKGKHLARDYDHLLRRGLSLRPHNNSFGRIHKNPTECSRFCVLACSTKGEQLVYFLCARRYCAIWTALRAAPFLIWSPTTQKVRP